MKRRTLVISLGTLIGLYLVLVAFAPAVIPKLLGPVGYRYLVPGATKIAMAQQANPFTSGFSACGVGSVIRFDRYAPEEVCFRSTNPVRLDLLRSGKPAEMVKISSDTWEYRSRYAPIVWQIKAWEREPGIIGFSVAPRPALN